MEGSQNHTSKESCSVYLEKMTNGKVDDAARHQYSSCPNEAHSDRSLSIAGGNETEMRCWSLTSVRRKAHLMRANF
jgi:hypothetical protein